MFYLGPVLLICVLTGFWGCGTTEVGTQNRAREAENLQVYDIYQSYMRSMNEQRRESGMNPEPIKSYEEWQRSPSTE